MATSVWTYGDIKEATRRYAKLKDATSFSEADLEKAITQYYHYGFVLDVKPPELKDYWEFSTTATDDTEALDDDEIVTISDYGRVDGNKLEIFFDEKNFYEDRWPVNATVADDRPIEALFMGGILTMRPAPDAVYSVKIPAWVRPLAFTPTGSGGLDSQLPTREEWGPLISIGTAKMLSGQFGNLDRYKSLGVMFEEEYDKLSFKAYEQQTHKRIRPKW